MIIAGVDYSLTSPAVCVFAGDIWSHENCKFYYLVKRAKSVVTSGPFSGTQYPEYYTDAHRYDNLASWSLDIMKANSVEEVFIEGYAFGATGRVFQIAENCGLLKHKLWQNKIPFDVFPPSVIKKLATTKGNANKERMYECFVEETGMDLRKILELPEKQWNPLSDIVDSFYIAKVGYQVLKSVDSSGKTV